jgi:dienelactone hydrolase
MTIKGIVTLVAAAISLAGAAAISAQAPAPRAGSPNPEARARMEAYNRKPDTAGTGRYAALKEVVPALPDHVVYRPGDLSKLGNTKLGVVAWGNGGCSPDGASSRLHLAELASHGYLVIASGRILSGPGAPANAAQTPRTTADSLTKALDWALAENTRRESPYFGRIDPQQIAVSGWSCGGLQALQIAAEPRVRAVVIHNSGVFNQGNSVSGIAITKDDLRKLHTPVIYILGGTTDIAYANGMDDFNRIDHVPVMVADLKAAGHGGTFTEDNGGAAASVAVSWLNWQLRGDREAAKRFVGTACELCGDARWSVGRKKMDLGTN